MKIKKWWIKSKIRAYILNAKWNYSFWLHAKRVYKNFNYKRKVDNYYGDDYNLMSKNEEMVSKKRFAGYLYKGNIYLDNPGRPILNREEWKNLNEKNML